MDLQTKLEWLEWTDTYWDILPVELKDIILEYRKSQEFIDRRESDLNRALCRQIGLYGQLRQKWQVGHIQCRPLNCNRGVKCQCMRVYGWYRDLRGVAHKVYLGIGLQHAMTNCDVRRVNYRNNEWMLIGIVRAPFR